MAASMTLPPPPPDQEAALSQQGGSNAMTLPPPPASSGGGWASPGMTGTASVSANYAAGGVSAPQGSPTSMSLAPPAPGGGMGPTPGSSFVAPSGGMGGGGPVYGGGAPAAGGFPGGSAAGFGGSGATAGAFPGGYGGTRPAGAQRPDLAGSAWGQAQAAANRPPGWGPGGPGGRPPQSMEQSWMRGRTGSPTLAQGYQAGGVPGAGNIAGWSGAGTGLRSGMGPPPNPNPTGEPRDAGVGIGGFEGRQMGGYTGPYGLGDFGGGTGTPPAGSTPFPQGVRSPSQDRLFGLNQPSYNYGQKIEGRFGPVSRPG